MAEFSTIDSKRNLQIGAVVRSTEVEGPGRRFAVWAQGCSVRCAGCFNPHLWNPIGGREVDPERLAEDACSADVQGVTLLGGEPFEQAEAFARFARAVQRNGLSVMTFTGYQREQLEAATAPAGSAELLGATDLLVDGPYVAELIDHERPWVGSKNQRFHFLSNRYEDLRDELDSIRDRLEIRISTAGEVSIGGWASVTMMDQLLGGSTRTIGRGTIR